MASPSSSVAEEDEPVAGPSRSPQQAQPTAEALETELQLDSFFPAPPNAFKRYTAANLELAAELQRLIVADESDAEEERIARQRRLLGDRAPDFDLLELVEPPDASWIAAKGGWSSFGEMWPVEEKMQTLQDAGIAQLYPSDLDRREALRRLLQTMLLSYLQLVDALLAGPPSLTYQQPGDTTNSQRLLAHIRTTAINMHHLCNELRPIQARESLKQLMRDQIEERKTRTAELRAACDLTSELLARLRTRYDAEPDQDAEMKATTDADDDYGRLLRAVDAIA